MKRLPIAAVLLIAANGLLAQQPYMEKVDVSIVNVDVTVTSRGAPARGLTKDDFELLEDGVPQPITHFYAIESAPQTAAAVTSAAAPAPQPAVDTPADPRFRRKVLVVFDVRHLSVHGRDVALRRLTDFIDRSFASGSCDWSVALVGNGAHLLLAPTDDKNRIHAALANIRSAAAGNSMREVFGVEDRIARPADGPDPSMTDNLKPLLAHANSLLAAGDSSRTYAAVRDITRAFANTEGRKIVLLVSGGFIEPESPLESPVRDISSQLAATANSLRDWLIREANASQVTMYILNPEGLTPTNIGADEHGDGNHEGMAETRGAANLAGLFWLAAQTGGKVFTGNFVDRSLRDFDEVASNYYSLAFRPPHGDDAKYHKISVRLKRPGRYDLAYRSGYSTMPTEARLDRVMTSMLATSMQNATLPLTVLTGEPERGDTRGALLVPLRVVVPAKELQFVPTADDSVARIDLWVSIFDGEGRLVTKFRATREAHAKPGSEAEGNFVESRALRLRGGRPYRVVVALHDQLSDAVGLKTTSIRPVITR